MTNLEVARIWAAQTGREAHTSNGNLWCREEWLYSYSTPIARFLHGVPFITAESFSITTEGKHKNAARRATNYAAFVVPFLRVGYEAQRGRSYTQAARDEAELHAANLTHYAEIIQAEQDRIARARVFKSEDHLNRLTAPGPSRLRRFSWEGEA